MSDYKFGDVLKYESVTSRSPGEFRVMVIGEPTKADYFGSNRFVLVLAPWPGSTWKGRWGDPGYMGDISMHGMVKDE